MRIGEATKGALIGATTVFLAGLLGYVAIIGEMRADIKSLQKQVDALNSKSVVTEATSGVRKGQLCLEIISTMKQAVEGNSSGNMKALSDQLERFDCYDGIAAASRAGNSSNGAQQ